MKLSHQNCHYIIPSGKSLQQ